MLLELDREQLRVLRRALEARVRDLQMRLGSEPGDEGFQRKVTLSTQLLRQVEALKRQAGHRAWGTSHMESQPEDGETFVVTIGSAAPHLLSALMCALSLRAPERHDPTRVDRHLDTGNPAVAASLPHADIGRGPK